MEATESVEKARKRGNCSCKGIRTCLICEAAAAAPTAAGLLGSEPCARPVARFVERRALEQGRTVTFDYCAECCLVRLTRARVLPLWREAEAGSHAASGHRTLRLHGDAAASFCLAGDAQHPAGGVDCDAGDADGARASASQPSDGGASYASAALVARSFSGITLVEDFVPQDLEVSLLGHFGDREWKPSQSGRRKLDYGPGVNFKRQKVKLGPFIGLPAASRPVVKLFAADQRCAGALAGFVPIECGVIEYDPALGAQIERHRDDRWLWGERIATLSLAAATTMSFSIECDDGGNGDGGNGDISGSGDGDGGHGGHGGDGGDGDCDASPGDASPGEARPLDATPEAGAAAAAISAASGTSEALTGEVGRAAVAIAAGRRQQQTPQPQPRPEKRQRLVEVRVALPGRSLLVMAGPARNAWSHAIHRRDIRGMRVSVTFRELAEAFQAGGAHEADGRALVERAATFAA